MIVLPQPRTQWDRFSHTPVGREKRLFLGHWESTVNWSSIIRNNKMKNLCGWTLKTIKSRCHNVNGCGTFEDVRVEQVGSASEREGRQKERVGFVSVELIFIIFK